jgi:hypothetical protein
VNVEDAKLGAWWLAVLRDPALPGTVEELDVVVPVVLQIPVGVGGEPVVAITVEDDLVLVRDAAAAERPAEVLTAEKVAFDLVLEVYPPVEPDRLRDVCFGVQPWVLVHLDDPDPVVVQVLLEPLRLHQYVLRILSHDANYQISDRLLLISRIARPSGHSRCITRSPAPAAAATQAP